MKAPTERQVAILRELAKEPYLAETPARLGYALGFQPFEGGGKSTRMFSPAQRIISSLNGLERRGYVATRRRRDGLSGTAYIITKAGQEFLNG